MQKGTLKGYPCLGKNVILEFLVSFAKIKNRLETTQNV